MDASHQPENANNAAGSAQGRDGATGSNANIPHVESPSLSPEQGEPTAAELASSDAPKTGGTALVVASVTDEPRQEQAQSTSSKRAAYARLKNWRLNKVSSLAASLALAVGAGIIAGAVGTLVLQRTATQEASANPKALQDSIVRLTTEFAAFKASAEASAKNANGQFTRLTERLDRAERAQAEPASKLAKISDAVERLEKRAAVSPAPQVTASAAAPPRDGADVTGSIAAASAPSKDLSRVPVMPGWVLHSVQGGAAIVQGRMGLLEIEVGDPLPGGGRVEAIRREGGRWVVVTSRGLIVAR